MQKTRLGKTAFYILSFTWGLPLTLFGCLTALVLRIKGCKSERYGWGRCFRVGNDHWGGFEAGFFFVRDNSDSDDISEHEFGHAIQNCILGPMMPFIVTIPSAIRYWNRESRIKRGDIPENRYDDIWFESQATRLGQQYTEKFKKEKI